MAIVTKALRSMRAGRDKLVAELAALRAQADAAGAERRRGLEEARAAVEAWREPERRLARLEQDDSAQCWLEQQRVLHVENALRANRSAVLIAFEAWLVRLRELQPPEVEEYRHRVTDERTIGNLDEIRRWERLQAAISDANREAGTLWREGTDATVKARCAHWRTTIEELAGDALVGDERPRRTGDYR